MIKINLLGEPRPKKARSAVPSVGPEIPNLMAVGAIIVAGTIACMGGWALYLHRDHSATEVRMAREQQRAFQYRDVESKYRETLERQRTLITIHEETTKLEAQKAAPVELMSELGNTVSATDRVWLTVMKDEGQNVTIEGVAMDIDAMANLMKNLTASGYFDNVEMKESYQDEQMAQKDIPEFVFSMSCGKHRTAPAPEIRTAEQKKPS